MIRRSLLACALAVLVGVGLVVAYPGSATAGPPSTARAAAGADHALSDEDPARDGRLYLVAMSAPGTAGNPGALSTDDYRTQLRQRQDAVLTALGLDPDDKGVPVYRWTTALSGFAARLTPDQAAEAARTPGVRMVEPAQVRRLSALASDARTRTAPATARTTNPAGPDRHRGRGVVVGVIDTGLDPASPVFVDTQTLGPTPRDFTGTCSTGEGWDETDCGNKVIAAQAFVEGFGADRLRAGSVVSPVDDSGHGTQVASIAVGNSEVTALSHGRRLGRFSGAAPDARLAVYKACWTAPDPDDDGCSTADLVSAVDTAVEDGVDVLNLSVRGRSRLDVLDLALLGAAEADVVVTAAAGNDGGTAGNATPWTTTVGATSGPGYDGALVLSDGTTVPGVLTARRGLDSRKVVLAASVPAPGVSRTAARLCRPGSLDAGRVADRIVVCDRGVVARVEKSRAVELADGAGMVLLDRRGQHPAADFHSVPTLHVNARDGRRLRRALADGPARGRMVTRPDRPGRRPRVLPWSAHGSPGGVRLEPDLVAPGFGQLAASSSSVGESWTLLSGSSAASARVSGLAARVRSAHPDWSATGVRSALMTSAVGTRGQPSALRQGAGLPRVRRALRPGLVFGLPETAYRQVLRRPDTDLNVPSALRRARRPLVIERSVTNVGPRAMYYSSHTAGFARSQVSVTPAALRLAPGETATFRIRVTPLPHDRGGPESGSVTWRSATGTRVRMPVVLTH